MTTCEVCYNVWRYSGNIYDNLVDRENVLSQVGANLRRKRLAKESYTLKKSSSLDLFGLTWASVFLYGKIQANSRCVACVCECVCVVPCFLACLPWLQAASRLERCVCSSRRRCRMKRR